MKKVLALYFFTLSQSLSAQSNDSTSLCTDSTFSSITTNFLLTPYKNFETINNSFITGSAITFLRNQNNPLITIDGIPANPTLLVNLPYKEFIGYPHLLSYDVETMSVNAFSTDSKIASGRFSNSVSLGTKDISRKLENLKFFVNNFSSINYQQSDTLGFSIINNVGVEKSGEKFFYRLSLTNGYHDSFLPNNGLKRSSGNLKIQLHPFKNAILTGFVDYSSFLDYKRQPSDHLNAERLFAYVNICSQLSRRLEVYGRASVHNSNDDMKFQLREEYEFIDPSTQSTNLRSVHYSYNADYINKSTFYEGGLRLRFLKNDFVESTAEFGFNQQKIKEQNATINQDETLPTGPSSQSFVQSDFSTVEDKFYTNIRLEHRIVSFKYLMDITAFEFSPLHATRLGKSTYSNHNINSVLRIFKSSIGNINDVQLKLTYARINNISLAPNRNTTTVPQSKTIWINRNTSDNYEIVLDIFLFRRKLQFDLAYYLNNWNDYRDTYYDTNSDYFGESLTWGDLVKSGIELNSLLSIIEHNDRSWTMLSSVSRNSLKFGSLYSWLEDSNESNLFFNVGNKFRYKNIQFQFLLEGKKGVDFGYFNRSIGLTYPVPLQNTYFRVVGAHNNGKAIYRESAATVPSVDYFTLKNITLRYTLKSNTGRIDNFTIGLSFDRLRNIFPHLNDIGAHVYNRLMQTPSFYNTLSLSTGISF